MSNTAVVSQHSEFITWLMNQLGMDPGKVRAFSLHAAVNEIVTVDVTYYPEEPGGDFERRTFKLFWEEVKE